MSATESPYRKGQKIPTSLPPVSLKPCGLAILGWGSYMALSILGLHVAHGPLMEISLIVLGLVAQRAVFHHGFVNGEREEHKRRIRKIDPGAFDRVGLDPAVVQRVVGALTSNRDDLNEVEAALDELRRDLTYAQMVAEIDRPGKE